VVLRVATLEGIQPEALKELNDVMLRLLSGSASIKKSAMGGVRTVAEMLNFMGSANETAVLDSIREYDPDLAQKILDEMFVFENLLDLDDRAIQLLLREIQSESLILAMKGATDPLREKIFRNMSQRASEMLREDLDSRGPVRLSEVKPSRRKSSRSSAASQMKARSCSAVRVARKWSELQQNMSNWIPKEKLTAYQRWEVASFDEEQGRGTGGARRCAA
jgi:flagellar motor switch protein FliG